MDEGEKPYVLAQKGADIEVLQKVYKKVHGKDPKGTMTFTIRGSIGAVER